MGFMKFKLLFSRLSWPVFFIAVMLQRSPVVRYLAEIELTLIPRIQHLWTLVAGAVTVGAYNTVTGESGDLRLRSGFDDTTVIVGENLRIVIEIEGDNLSPEDWRMTDPLPDGVSWFPISNATTGVIDGVPTETGSWDITVRAWQRPNMRGDEASPVSFKIVVDPLISQQPAAQAVDLGGAATLSLAVANSEGVTLQWQKQNMGIPEIFDDLADQTGATFNLNGVAFDDVGNYRAVVTKGSIVEISDVVSLTVNSLISEQPLNQTVAWNGSPELKIVLVEPTGVTYQWQKQNSENPELFDDLPGQTGAVLELVNARSNDSGNYQVVVTKDSVMEVSLVALLTVDSTPLQIWLDAHFEDPFAIEAGEEQNNDFDNFNNLHESLFGGDPNVPDSIQFPEVSQEIINETRYAVFRFPAIAVGTESQIAPEVTDELAENNWTPIQNGLEGVIIESSPEGYLVKVPASDRQFLRLLYSSAP
jgi:hypothetical protein